MMRAQDIGAPRGGLLPSWAEVNQWLGQQFVIEHKPGGGRTSPPNL